MNNINTAPPGEDSATDFAEKMEASMGGRVTIGSRVCGFGMAWTVLEGGQVKGEEHTCRFDAETAGLEILAKRMKEAKTSTEKILIENQVVYFLKKSCRPSYVSDLMEGAGGIFKTL